MSAGDRDEEREGAPHRAPGGDGDWSPEADRDEHPVRDDRKPGDQHDARGDGKNGQERPEDERARRLAHDPPPPPRRRLALFVGVPLALLLCWGAFTHWQQRSDARETLQQQQQHVPEVHVATARRDDGLDRTLLPGQTAAFFSADLWARATGYIAERRVDIGSRVKKGDLLLRIAAPDLDQQLEQARAQLGQMQAALTQAQASLNQAQSNKKLADVNSWRASTLAAEGWDTKQNRDTQATNLAVNTKSVSSAQAGIGVAVANIRAQQATVDRLVALTGYERVLAPFDGVITQRDVDVGDLVTADANTGTALLHIDQQDVLRCQVYVPQSQFVGIHDGLGATVTVPEMPGQHFRATVSRSAVALAQNSRSMLVEVDIENREGKLTPGLFVTVGFDVSRPSPVVVVPDASLIFDQTGLHVAVVENGHAVMRKVTVARDLGTEAELHDGLQGGEQVIVNPPTLLADNESVRVATPEGGNKQDNKPKS
ncbi:efflux RND transporter periplasmic adaptor subunit [Rhizosaccharibacter radicis]|uniref:Efflux RND transporter periplasmic adaptor subunit n=1 Tax=Rhizosaccharibacter radicis TaxID=2782605 RepID=A0ABT1W1C4_9PROT|nr:efflux RND transporter periplasmic adaptor subunit [Acetobacteraceae bacterium KSS12]